MGERKIVWIMKRDDRGEDYIDARLYDDDVEVKAKQIRRINANGFALEFLAHVRAWIVTGLAR